MPSQTMVLGDYQGKYCRWQSRRFRGGLISKNKDVVWGTTNLMQIREWINQATELLTQLGTQKLCWLKTKNYIEASEDKTSNKNLNYRNWQDWSSSHWDIAEHK